MNQQPRSALCTLLGCFFLVAWVTCRATPRWIHGRVLAGNEPVAGARVGFQGERYRVRTSDDGRFRLPRTDAGEGRIVASRSGYFIAGAAAQNAHPHAIVLNPHPQEESEQYRWIDPNPSVKPDANKLNCANCHGEIYREWSASSHAQSATNRHFRDMFYGTNWNGAPDAGWSFVRDHEEARAVCAACHLPGVSVADPAAADPLVAVGVAREGVHCDFCHKIAEVHGDVLGLSHGRDAVRLVRPAGDRQVFFGPMDDVDRGRDAYAPLYRSSRYCAGCHEGTLFGTPAYTTYSEWASSSYARRGVQCQDCHMKPDGLKRNIAPGHGGVDRNPGTLSSHHFPGSRHETMLRGSVELKLSAWTSRQALEVDVTIRPVDVGHRLPTGTPERHLLLVVLSDDLRGNRLRQISGPRVPSLGGVGAFQDGNFAGLAGKLYAKLLTRQHTTDPVPAPFWQEVVLQEDTRLEPDTTDRVRFRFGRKEHSGPYRVRAQLIYRRFYKEIIDAKSWPDRDTVLARQETTVP